ncbi:MAG: hypothetical protein ABW001_08135 [Mycobacterium sp.]
MRTPAAALCALAAIVLAGGSSTQPVSAPPTSSASTTPQARPVARGGDETRALFATAGMPRRVTEDLATNTSTVLLGPGVNGGGVVNTVAFKGQR